MTVRKEDGRWFYRRWVRVPGAKPTRIYGTPREYNLPNTRSGAEEAERRAVREVIDGKPAAPPEPQPSACPTLAAFAPTFIQHSRAKNKPRSVNSKEQILRDHILPALGDRQLDAVTFAAIEDFKHALLAKPYREKPRSAKMVNNALTVLRRLLVLAKKRGHIVAVPEIEWLRLERPDFDFLDFDESDRLADAADGEWRAMIQLALRSGLRQGELLALRWEDVDIDRYRLVVSHSVSRGVITAPKGGKPRTVELGEVVTAILRSHRHLRGPLVFCDLDGKMLPAGSCKHPIYRACRKAKLRRIGWHVLRHTYASHLAMLGATPKTIQEQLGHASLEMTMRYMHLAPATKAAAARLLDRPARILPDREQSGGK